MTTATIPPSYAQVGLNYDQTQALATTLGYKSVDDLPPLYKLSTTQMTKIRAEKPEVYKEINSHLFGVTNPQLEPPKGEKLDTARLTILLAELNKIIGDIGLETGKEGVKITKEQKAAKNKERADKMKEAREKQEAAKNKDQTGKILGWIGVGLAIVAAVVVVALTAGAAAPLMACAIVGLVCAVASGTVMLLEEDLDGDGMGEMESMMRDTCKARGMSEEETQKYMKDVRLAITITIAVVGVLSALGSAVGGGIAAYKAANAAANVGKAAQVASSGGKAAQAASTGSKIAKTAKSVSTVKKVGTVASSGLEVAEGGVAVAQGANTIDTTKARTDAMKARADAKEIQAWITKLQAALQEETEELAKIMEKLNKLAFDDPKKILQSIQETMMALASEQGSAQSA